MNSNEEKQKSCVEKYPNQCHCAFKCLGNEFCDSAEEKINQLKAELTVQKAVAKGFSEGLAQTEKLLEKVKAENERLKADKKQLLKDCNSCNFHKYKQALEEMRKYIDKYCSDCDIDERSNTYEKCDDCIAADIRNTINEVL